jgi:hypothetical protein
MSKTLSLQRSSGVFILVLNYTGAVFTVLLDVFVLGTRWAFFFFGAPINCENMRAREILGEKVVVHFQNRKMGEEKRREGTNLGSVLVCGGCSYSAYSWAGMVIVLIACIASVVNRYAVSVYSPNACLLNMQNRHV